MPPNQPTLFVVLFGLRFTAAGGGVVESFRQSVVGPAQTDLC